MLDYRIMVWRGRNYARRRGDRLPIPSGKALRRNAILYRVLRGLIAPFVLRRFRFESEEAPDFPSPYVIISNHVTELDFFFVARTLKKPMTFVVGESLFRNRFVAWLIGDMFGCISKQKGTADVQTAMGMLRWLRQKGNVCLYAEGSTTFDGHTACIPQATGTLLRTVGAGLITYRVEGAYFAMPRWGRGIRRGKTRGHVINTYSPEQLKGMSADSINAALLTDLCEDAYARQETEQIPYRGRRLAEGLEYALYCCPKCLSVGALNTRDDRVACTCGMRARYLPTGFFADDLPFRSVDKWMAWQREHLREMVKTAGDNPLFRDDNQQLSLRGEGHSLQAVAKGLLTISPNALCVGDTRFPIADICGMEIYRKGTLLFSTAQGLHYQIDSPYARSALKYRDAWQFVKEGRD